MCTCMKVVSCSNSGVIGAVAIMALGMGMGAATAVTGDATPLTTEVVAAQRPHLRRPPQPIMLLLPLLQLLQSEEAAMGAALALLALLPPQQVMP